MIFVWRYKMTSNSRENPIDTCDDCPCSGANLIRLLKPAIMTILAGKGAHGYAIVERLAEKVTDKLAEKESKKKTWY